MDVVALSSKKAAILTLTAAGRFSIFIMDFTLGSSTETQSTYTYPQILLDDLSVKPAGQFYKLDSISSAIYTEAVITGYSKGFATSSGGSDSTQSIGFVMPTVTNRAATFWSSPQNPTTFLLTTAVTFSSSDDIVFSSPIV